MNPDNLPAWLSAIGWASVGAMLLWLFLTLVLGWPQL